MNNNNSNPKAAIDALLETENKENNYEVKPITMGRYALLELVNSPFITSDTKFSLTNLIPSFYVMTQPIQSLKGYNSKNIDELIENAMEWADGFDVDDSQSLINTIFEKLGLMRKVSPDGTDEDVRTKKEEPQVEMVG